jgi:CheY-specific phosphatase CheX
MDRNDSIIESALTNAVSETMENMAFEQVDMPQPDNPPQATGEKYFWASLPIIKPLTGRIEIQLSIDYARILAQSLFEGSDNKPTDDLVKDAVAEVLNTIAGRFMTQLVPPKEEFELGLPNVIIGKCPADQINGIHRSFDVGGHLLTAFLFGITENASMGKGIKEEILNHENLNS